jgi:uncharacterized iron-regulated membrane protein
LPSSPTRLRPALVLVHRWVGLVLAGFLLIAGVTGCLLAWNHQLEAAISPGLFRANPSHSDAQPLDPLVLRERVAKLYPNASIAYVPLRADPGHSVWMFLEARTDPSTGNVAELPNDQVFVHPYTGEVLGERKWGDISQGLENLMPFIYRLHYTLALGVVGTYVFGIVALLWTIDCFVGAYLTFPGRTRTRPASTSKASDKSWLARWWPSWKLRWRGGSHKVNFDLHRAGGLWVWAMLFVLAWSGVAFNLREVYRAVMETAFEFAPAMDMPAVGPPQAEPRLSWVQAREQGRRLMAEQAAAGNFTVRNETGLSYDASRAVYRYSVNSSRDIRDAGGGTAVVFDANTGGLRQMIAPSGMATGDTITQWLTSLHMAAVWGAPFKVFVSAVGLLVAMLSVTGTIIWLRKRKAQAKSLSQRFARASGTHKASMSLEGASCSCRN